MPTEDDARHWMVRSTLIAVADLERSLAFYAELGPFREVAREDAVAIIGGSTPDSLVLILRETRSTHHIRHGQQSLGLRGLTFNVGSREELNRVESVLRDKGLLTGRQEMAGGVAQLVFGRDPDNQPLAFVSYTGDIGADYYHAVARRVFSLDT